MLILGFDDKVGCLADVAQGVLHLLLGILVKLLAWLSCSPSAIRCHLLGDEASTYRLLLVALGLGGEMVEPHLLEALLARVSSENWPGASRPGA